ncbi:MAG TPA: hypothetical protein H9908_05785 [Candidatus Rothia avistercoris]|uniref:Nucleotidyl transferase domain-containing protein n=1 Tax=Candidatus Rothia avistercoris TaxID=2840479 RepID=A0A9D2UFD1_9MICC|nr:hypothetical protein [Candidatus Rothia avistercoris]
MPLLESAGAQDVIVMSADHLYQLDLRPVLAQHAELGSDLTVVTTVKPSSRPWWSRERFTSTC